MGEQVLLFRQPTLVGKVKPVQIASNFTPLSTFHTLAKTNKMIDQKCRTSWDPFNFVLLQTQ